MTLDWMSNAACVTVDNDLFFPEIGQNSHQARAVCRTCPARLACLEYALENDLRFGVYGGITEQNRKQLRPGGGQRAINHDNDRHDAAEEDRVARAGVVADKKRARERAVSAAARARAADGTFLGLGGSS